MKTGECYYRGTNGDLWLAISHEDESGVVSTVQVWIEAAEEVAVEELGEPIVD